MYDQLFQDQRRNFVLIIVENAVVSLTPLGCDYAGFDRSNCKGLIDLFRIAVKSLMGRFKDSSFTCWILDYCPDEAYEHIDI